MEFDRVVDIYDTTRGAPSPDTIKILVEELNECKCKSVLDMGVGTGRIAKPLLEYKFKIIGIDVSRSMIKLAKEKSIVKVVVGDVCKTPFRDRRFDCALLVHMLHLIANWYDLLSETRRVTRKKLLSIAGKFEPEKLSIRHLYLDKVRFYGFRQVYDIEGKEIELAKLVKPEKSQMISSFYETRNLDEIIDLLDKRKTSITWGVPDNIHNRVIEELRKKYSSKRIEYHFSNFLLTWNINDFNDDILQEIDQYQHQT